MTPLLIADRTVADGSLRFSRRSLVPAFILFSLPQVANPGHQRATSVSEKPDVQQTTAEKDMEIIRSKRASSSGGSIVGQQKTKYRKRSVSSPLSPLTCLSFLTDSNTAGISPRKMQLVQHP